MLRAGASCDSATGKDVSRDLENVARIGQAGFDRVARASAAPLLHAKQ
jgi:hypothetical protein